MSTSMGASKKWRAAVACAWVASIVILYYLVYAQNSRYSALIVSILKKAVGAS